MRPGSATTAPIWQAQQENERPEISYIRSRVQACFNVGQVCQASVIQIHYELLMQPLVGKCSKLILPCATLKLRTPTWLKHG